MLYYQARKSFVHSLDARAKLVLLILMNIALFVSLNPSLTGGVLILLLLGYLAARVSLVRAVRELGIVWVFLFLPFLVGFVLGEPFMKGIAVFGRFVAVVLAAILFVYTTKQRDIARALTFFKVPAKVALMFTVALRFVPVIQEEVYRVRAAQMARGYVRGWLVIPILVPVLRRSLVRARYLSMSLDSRGFDSEIAEI